MFRENTDRSFQFGILFDANVAVSNFDSVYYYFPNV